MATLHDLRKIIGQEYPDLVDPEELEPAPLGADPLAPFKALADGLGFFYWPAYEHEGVFTLLGGSYSNGDGALYVMTYSGEAEDELSVCLAGDLSLGFGEFWVKLDEDRGTGTTRARLFGAVMATGFFHRTGVFASAGYVDRYAEKWSFARCLPAMPSHRSRKVSTTQVEACFRVLCPQCMAERAEAFEKEKELRDAKRSVELLEKMDRVPYRTRYLGEAFVSAKSISDCQTAAVTRTAGGMRITKIKPV